MQARRLRYEMQARPGSGYVRQPYKQKLGNCMKSSNRYIERFHHSVGWLGTIFLMLPILTWVWLAAKEPFISVFNGAVPSYVISGKLFSEKFDICHAGFCLDQPTIGKWLFWFSVMMVSSLPYVTTVRWISNRKSRCGYLAYGISIVILCIFLLCILSWPLCWLIQYVCSMGLTSRRVYGLLYGIGGGILVIGFFAWAIRKPKEQKIASDVE